MCVQYTKDKESLVVQVYSGRREGGRRVSGGGREEGEWGREGGRRVREGRGRE